MESHQIQGIVEAYNQVVENQQLDESMASSSRMAEIKKSGGFDRPPRSREFEKRLPNPTPPRSREFEQRLPKPTLKNSADLFDIIKGHLIDEGYVETEEAAIAIMANMSEEWRQSIISEVAGLIPLAGLAATAVKKVQDWGNSPSTGPDDRLRDAPKGMSPEERKKRSNTNPVTGRTNKPL